AILLTSQKQRLRQLVDFPRRSFSRRAYFPFDSFPAKIRLEATEWECECLSSDLSVLIIAVRAASVAEKASQTTTFTLVKTTSQMEDPSSRSSWLLDLPTTLNSGFDTICLSLGIYILVTRLRTSDISSKPSQTTTSALTTPSLWTRKRLSILCASALATTLVQLTRILLIASLSYDAYRTAAAAVAPGTDDKPTQDNPLMRPPALYGVLALPVFTFFSRGLLILLFALPTTTKKHPLAPPPTPSSPVVSTQHAIPPSPRPRKGSVAPNSPKESSFPLADGPLPPHLAHPPSPIWQFVSSLPSRLYGPTQNLYLIAFYSCILFACIFVPFSYHTYWYFDIPRIELVLSLYLAAILRDAKNVPGLTVKEKRARGIPTLERVVYARWLGLAILFLEVPVETLWKVLLDGSVMFILWRADA
ncbi:hypothetical protein M408DRAFT_91655, partial [Serendipita vermifera MAFF 305830]